MQIDTSILSVLLALAGFLVGQLTAAKKSGKEDGELRANVRYIKESVDKQDEKLDAFTAKYEDIRKEVEALKNRLGILEQRVSLLHGGD